MEGRILFSILGILLVGQTSRGEQRVLTPPYFNLAEGRNITATATCGEERRELYCKLVGANSDNDVNINLIQGQVCDYCDLSEDGRDHPAANAIDGSEKWWQSPPLSRGVKYNQVNLTINFDQEFHVAYVFITMANSPRPGVWVLERSSDYGKTYKPWQYFAETPGDCENFFGKESLLPITRDDSVICETQYSKIVPLEGGEIVVSLLNNRPSSEDFFSSDVLQEWTRATNIRLRLLRTKTLLGHLMSVARKDASVTRRYFYSIKDISVGGRCRCNGHADLCEIDERDPSKLLCKCKHGTCGPQCESCCSPMFQKAWRPSTNTNPFSCEACNCHGHSNECYYDEEVNSNSTSLDETGKYEGGGVCLNCWHNTEGINCHKCKPGYYRPYGKQLDAPDVCQECVCDDFFSTGNCAEGSGRCECRPEFLPPNCDKCNSGYYDYPNCKPCDCHFNGTRDSVCEVGGGQCPCKQNFAGTNCDRCAEGFYSFPHCKPCECEDLGSVSPVCDPDDGQCECGNNYGSRQCNQCENGYFNFPTCSYCNCDVRGTREGICDKGTGVCLCREGYGGARCDQCLPSFYGYPDCRTCNCSSVGSATTICDATGKCPCLQNFAGRACDQCYPGYYKYPECLPCDCIPDGSMGVSCDDEGKCQCKLSFDGLRCETCKEGFYNFPLCEDCNCDPAGVVESFSGCGDSPPGELCQCKERAQGRICNDCKPLYWNLQHWNPQGCEDCDCHLPGILGGVQVCEGKSGQCPCKPSVGSRRCEECQDGFYNLLGEDLLGCEDCGCDVGGAVNNVCEKTTGQCTCRPRITGQTCTTPIKTHYFPSLYQFQYEAEDGNTPAGGPVRFGYDENEFPGHSWRGYAIYSQLQPETLHEVEIEKSSLYRIIFHYHNPSDQTINGEIIVTPDNPNDVEQKYKVRFEPKSNFVTVSTGNVPSPFVLNPGRWQVGIKTDQHLFVDYFTLLPAAFYEAAILQQRVTAPCLLNTEGEIEPDSCLALKYPSIDKFDSVYGTEAFREEGGTKLEPNEFYRNRKVLKALDVDQKELLMLSPKQKKVKLDLSISKSGRYAIVIEYYTPFKSNLTSVNVEATSNKGTAKGKSLIYNCLHATLCRDVVINEEGEVAVFKFDPSIVAIELEVPEDSEEKIVIQSIRAIPLFKWSLDYIRPKEYCVMDKGICAPSDYDIPPESTKVEAEASVSEDRIYEDENYGDKKLVQLNKDKSLEITGRVPFPGWYSFLVHYHQPDNPDFSIDVLVQNGQHYEAKFPVVHCPSTAGCRAIATQDDKNVRFHVNEEFSLSLKGLKTVLIDYVLAVPSPNEDSREVIPYMEQSPADETRRFIAECGKSHMHISTDVIGLCRDAVFSLTTEFNNGALFCACDNQGSKSFQCAEFGGQCQCKENVIGRRCERCKTMYFGFPNCKPCDCPSTAFCDENTGECICPPRVTGEKCDRCMDNTYGYDALIGCEECACSPLGVQEGNLQCDLENGACECKSNVVGRSCDRCHAGFWAFPYCQLCDCDLRGTTGDICNQESSQCYCKANVEGRNCESCKAGSFNLEEANPAGCTKCFCFGKTTRCSSSPYYWTGASAGKKQWTAVGFDPNKSGALSESNYEIEFEEISSEEAGDDFVTVYIPEGTIPLGNESNALYFKAQMNQVKGNFLASYGGKLTYSLLSEPEDSIDAEREIYGGADVILEGKDLSASTTIRLLHFTLDHLNKENVMNMNLRIIEENFDVMSGNGGLVAATREQMMIVLKNLAAVYVKASYFSRTREVKLSSFGLEIGKDEHGEEDNRALSVEQCACPRNYQGPSCEECAPGYFRSNMGPFGGFCIPCQCNSHSETCDSTTGICSDCRHSTTGDHCEMCEVGYHGDATQGTGKDCLICACPLPMASNNFATSCQVSSDGQEISCDCREGYSGARCNVCAAGYYGRPDSPGDYCKPCECSGNIDVLDPYACDSITGECLRCLNNTGGPTCNQCARGFHGDAIEIKDCRACDCKECGTEECDHLSGECRCKHNVVGATCERCAPDHYGMTSCENGCDFCECSIASMSTQCNDATGQCPCKKGTTGRRCERCSPGYWNYTKSGCQSCECNSDYAIGVGCDPETGQCSCLPGVVGEKCDRCPYRWVLIEDRGCQECDSCQHQLLDDTDKMSADLNPIIEDFQSVAVSYFTTQKLSYFNKTANELEPEVRLLDPNKVNLYPYTQAILMLEADSKSGKQRAEVTSDSLATKALAATGLREKSIEVESRVQEAVARARTAVFETKDLMEGLTAIKFTNPSTDAAMTEAQGIVESMQLKSPSIEDALNKEREIAEKTLEEVKEFLKPHTAMQENIKKEKERVENATFKMADIGTHIENSLKVSREAQAISNKIKEGKYDSKIKFLEQKIKETEENIANATAMNNQTPDKINELRSLYDELGTFLNSVKESKEPLEQMMDTLKNELENNVDTINLSQEHVRKLRNEANGLEAMMAKTRIVSDNAITAATSYQKITTALEEAEASADNADKAADDTSQMTSSIGELAATTQQPSQNLLVLANQSLAQVDADLRIPLNGAKMDIDEIEELNKTMVVALNNIHKNMDKLSGPRDLSDIHDAIVISTNGDLKADEALTSVEEILEKLPKSHEDARKLPVTIKDLNKGLAISETQLKQAKEAVPFSAAITGNLESKKPKYDNLKSQISDKMSDLKAKIASAREQANRIPVGMNLQESSSLLMANPTSLESQQAQTKVALHFKTQEPSGLLLFLGNEPGRKSEDDFMALEIDGGYPVLTIDLGSGPQKVYSDQFVADDKWYKATIDRSGKMVRLTVAQDFQNGSIVESTKEEYLSGPKSLLNVNQNASKIYVGGYPEEETRPNLVRSTTYRGAIEGLEIGDEKVGLWNFKQGENLAPAMEKDIFLDSKTESGLRFQGSGYAVMDRNNIPFKTRSNVRLKFLTRAKNGLIFLVGMGRKFMSLEIINGMVIYQYNLGGGPVRESSRRAFNDGKWHQVEAVREKRYGVLRIDGEEVARMESPEPHSLLAVSNYMYFGGYPGNHDYQTVTNKGFEGCIDKVLVDNVPIELTQAAEARYTVLGCPASFGPTVATFTGSGFIKVKSEDSPTSGPVISYKEDSFELGFRFKRNGTHGLLFYGANKDQSNFLSVSLAEGSLYIKTEPGSAQIKTDSFSDSEWHVVTVSRDRTKLSVNIDDMNEYSEHATGGILTLTSPGSMIFFGGRPDDYEMREGATIADSAFTGCMGDITINGKRVDFEEAEIRGSTLAQSCSTSQEVLESESPKHRNGFAIPQKEGDDEDEISRLITTTTKRPTTTESDLIPMPDVDEDEDNEFDSEEDKKLTPPEPTPTPFMGCKLPFRDPPAENQIVNLEDGIRFGNYEKTSRMEFKQPQADEDMKRTEYSIEFKTNEPDGIIFMWTHFDKIDFVGLFMKKGRVHFAYDSGSGPTVLNSTTLLNDSIWHTASFSRFLKQGELSIDGVVVATGTSPGSTNSINAGNTIYVGGLPRDVWVKKTTLRKIQNVDSPFRGCLRNFMMKKQIQMPSFISPSLEPCTDDVEPGYSFYPNSGFLKLTDKFKVGRKIKLSLSIKPRHPSGIILSVHGEKDFMILQLVNGTLKFTVDNGKGPLSSSFTKDIYDLCDGNWHTIQVSKSKNVVTLALDNTFSSPGIGVAGPDQTNTNHPLYLGGHPKPREVRGFETYDQFVGCMKDLQFENLKVPLKFTHEGIQGKVGLHSCPIN